MSEPVRIRHHSGKAPGAGGPPPEGNGGAWERLLDEMESMTGDEVQDEIDKVHERHEFILCAHCRKKFHALLAELRRG